MDRARQEKKVSVIIPTYNRAKFIPGAVKSIINQKYDNIEIILVDDGSNDDTQTVVHSLQGTYSNIFYYHNDRSKGPSGARNTGIIRSSGEYLSFLDSDDIWLDNHLKNGLEVLDEHPEIDVLFGNFRVVDLKNGKHLYDFFDQKEVLHTLKSIRLSSGIRVLQDNVFLALIRENFFHLGSIIVRKAKVNGILLDESIMFAEDRDFGIRLYREANATFAYREYPVFVLNRHDSNLYNNSGLNNWLQIAKTHLYLYTKYLEGYHLSDDEKKILTKHIIKYLLNFSYACGKRGEYRKALAYVLRSVKYRLSLIRL